MFRLISLIREPFLLGFSTACSEAAYPVTMAQLEKLPVSKKIISFVLPMGYSFNLDGSRMYCTFAVIFISQAYNIPLSVPQQITMLLVTVVPTPTALSMRTWPPDCLTKPGRRSPRSPRMSQTCCGLLQRLRTDDALPDIPVILLSARAGEESRIEGLEAGADDYLVKPFSARELLARVGACLMLTRVRQQGG